MTKFATMQRHKSANAGHLNGVLIRRGARLNVTHKYGGNPLGTAIYCAAYFPNPNANYPHAVERLIDAGLPVTEEHLKFALDHELDEVADALKSRGAAM